MNRKIALLLLLFCAVLATPELAARSFTFKYLGAKGSKGDSYFTSQTRQGYFSVKVGSASKNDCMDELEIRAATVMKGVNDRKIAINDIASLAFVPKNVGKALYFEVVTGASHSNVGGQRTYDGWQMAGCIIEIRQGGKIIKRWLGAQGVPKGMTLDDNVEQMRLRMDGRYGGAAGENFDNATKIISVTNNRKPIELAEVLAQFPDPEPADAKAATKTAKPLDVKETVDGEDTSDGEFKITKFCGYTFGTEKPDLTQKSRTLMARPFRQYEYIKLIYGESTKVLVGVTIEAARHAASPEERDTLAASAAGVFEKKYGIKLEYGNSCYKYENSHACITIDAYSIKVVNKDYNRKEEMLHQQEAQQQQAIRDANRTKAKEDAKLDGADVL